MKPNESTHPLVSVIVPVYNTEKYITESLESVLNQTYQPIEIICCDDGSTDNSRSIIESIQQQYPDRITLIMNEKNSGIAISRNNALAYAHGDFIAFMDADDIWLPNKIEIQMNALNADPDSDMSFTLMQCFLSPDIPESVKAIRHCPTEPTPGQTPGTTLIRRKSFEKVGLFNTEWRVGEFIDWLARARDLGLTFTHINQVLYLRRIHETNTGVTERPSRIDYLKIVKEALERKRSQSEL